METPRGICNGSYLLKNEDTVAWDDLIGIQDRITTNATNIVMGRKAVTQVTAVGRDLSQHPQVRMCFVTRCTI